MNTEQLVYQEKLLFVKKIAAQISLANLHLKPQVIWKHFLWTDETKDVYP